MDAVLFVVVVVVVAVVGAGLGLALAPRLTRWDDRRNRTDDGNERQAEGGTDDHD